LAYKRLQTWSFWVVLVEFWSREKKRFSLLISLDRRPSSQVKTKIFVSTIPKATSGPEDQQNNYVGA
jgi:hypothetical protein